MSGMDEHILRACFTETNPKPLPWDTKPKQSNEEKESTKTKVHENANGKVVRSSDDEKTKEQYDDPLGKTTCVTRNKGDLSIMPQRHVNDILANVTFGDLEFDDINITRVKPLENNRMSVNATKIYDVGLEKIRFDRNITYVAPYNPSEFMEYDTQILCNLRRFVDTQCQKPNSTITGGSCALRYEGTYMPSFMNQKSATRYDKYESRVPEVSSSRDKYVFEMSKDKTETTSTEKSLLYGVQGASKTEPTVIPKSTKPITSKSMGSMHLFSKYTKSLHSMAIQATDLGETRITNCKRKNGRFTNMPLPTSLKTTVWKNDLLLLGKNPNIILSRSKNENHYISKTESVINTENEILEDDGPESPRKDKTEQENQQLIKDQSRQGLNRNTAITGLGNKTVLIGSNHGQYEQMIISPLPTDRSTCSYNFDTLGIGNEKLSDLSKDVLEINDEPKVANDVEKLHSDRNNMKNDVCTSKSKHATTRHLSVNETDTTYTASRSSNEDLSMGNLNIVNNKIDSNVCNTLFNQECLEVEHEFQTIHSTCTIDKVSTSQTECDDVFVINDSDSFDAISDNIQDLVQQNDNTTEPSISSLSTRWEPPQTEVQRGGRFRRLLKWFTCCFKSNVKE